MTMDVQLFEITEYMIVWRQLERQTFNGVSAAVRALIRCTGGEYTMDVYFLDPASDFPDPFYDVRNKKGYFFLPIADIGPFVDMLRNEKPVYGHLRGDRPEWISVTTGKEPVGEGEGK